MVVKQLRLFLLVGLIACENAIVPVGNDNVTGTWLWYTFDTMKNPIVDTLILVERNDSIFTNILNYDTVRANFKIISRKGRIVGVNEFKIWNEYLYSDSIFIQIYDKEHGYLTWCLNSVSFNVTNWYYGKLTKL